MVSNAVKHRGDLPSALFLPPLIFSQSYLAMKCISILPNAFILCGWSNMPFPTVWAVKTVIIADRWVNGGYCFCFCSHPYEVMAHFFGSPWLTALLDTPWNYLLFTIWPGLKCSTKFSLKNVANKENKRRNHDNVTQWKRAISVFVWMQQSVHACHVCVNIQSLQM